MSDTALVYVTDAGFLYPTMVSAIQASGQVVDSGVNILIYLVNVDDITLETLKEATKNLPIFYSKLPNSAFDLPLGTSFAESHVPKVSLARLNLHDCIPENYKNLIYVDGDTQVVGSLSDLFRVRVRHGWIAAGRGSLWMWGSGKSRGGKADIAYLSRIGVSSPANYFNAGVLLLSRDTLGIDGPKAFEYFVSNSKICRQHDQSALNHVFNNKLIELHPKYNFHSFYSEMGADSVCQPAIVHFTGPFKPWQFTAGWLSRYSKAYDEFDAKYPELAGLRIPLTVEQLEQKQVAWNNAQKRPLIRTAKKFLRLRKFWLFQRREFREFNRALL